MLSTTLVAVASIILVTIIILYLGVWAKLKSSSSKLANGPQNGRKQKYFRSAKVMIVLVLAYIFQYWPYIPYIVFVSVSSNQYVIYSACMMVAVFCNLGGFMNFIAYTFIRRRYIDKRDKKGNCVDLNDSNNMSSKSDTNQLQLQ